MINYFVKFQRWRRRWFALRHSGELPGQYFLEYYTDRRCRKLKGHIDLDQCEQVIYVQMLSLNCIPKFVALTGRRWIEI